MFQKKENNKYKKVDPWNLAIETIEGTIGIIKVAVSIPLAIAILPFSFFSSIPVWGQFAASFPDQGDLSFSYALATGGGFSDKIGWFVEFYGNMTEKSQGIDAGTTYLINNTMQVDLSGGALLENYNFVELGFSFRLPQ